tara:strand:+ start:6213 stop:6539 length:327 start_codon:yes stop_codon:yes gene_type:complete
MAPDPRVYPSDIGPSQDERNLRVVWGDGVVSEYDPRSLRILCPCAGCVDEMTGERTLKAETVERGVYPTAIHYVGQYALQFVWSDGHSTGLYTFEYLREIWDRSVHEA